MALISSGSVGENPRPGPTSQKGDPVGLKEYDVVINGTQTTLQLSDEDAKLHGLTKSDLSSARLDAEAEAKAAAEKERAEVEAKERAEAEAKAKAEAEAKAAAAAANKGGKQPTNKQSEAAGQAFGAKDAQA